MNTSVERNRIAKRASTLRAVRTFFDSLGYLEVDTPALSRYASVDCYIDPFQTVDGGYLHTSPELAMKRLLANGSGDIYYLGHVFRREEVGTLHNCEFTMIEWYKTHTDEETFLQEVCELHFLFLGRMPVELLPYQEAWDRYSQKPDRDISSWQEDEQRHYIWSLFVEPNLGRNKLTLITDFPKEEALLAQTRIRNGIEVAARFEVYYQGIELANGFHELSSKEVAKDRFDEANRLRKQMGKSILPPDPHFLAALDQGLPPNTYGIAAGFDRLLMLQQKSPSLAEIILN